jgi:nicotinamidase/pyrazinamidase
LDLTPGIASASGEKKTEDKFRAWEEAVPSSIAISARDVLVVIDVETDLLPGSSPAIADDDALAPLVNRLARAFDTVVFTQGLHPESHAAPPSSHHDAKPFDPNVTLYGDQAPLPDQCEPGADLGEGLGFDRAFLILSKGADGEVESHSAHPKAEGETTTSLAALLKARGISRVFACGLATNYCVARLMLDARAAGLETFVIEDACRAIDANGSFAGAWSKMNAAEVWRIQARQILG